MVKIYEYLTYKGRSGQWAWIFHRVTGVGVFLFLLTHVIDTALIGWGPEPYNKMMAIYHMPFFRVGEVVLTGMVLYHALNGVRIIIIDFWPETTAAHRKWTYAMATVFALLFIPTAIVMLKWVVK
jgi:succinate dehydrogenase / fumarate reductase, cytochrome b subunit